MENNGHFILPLGGGLKSLLSSLVKLFKSPYPCSNPTSKQTHYSDPSPDEPRYGKINTDGFNLQSVAAESTLSSLRVHGFYSIFFEGDRPKHC